VKHAIHKALAVTSDRIGDPLVFYYIDADAEHHA
jgi:hypothetical protein